MIALLLRIIICLVIWFLYIFQVDLKRMLINKKSKFLYSTVPYNHILHIIPIYKYITVVLWVELCCLSHGLRYVTFPLFRFFSCRFCCPLIQTNGSSTRNKLIRNEQGILSFQTTLIQPSLYYITLQHYFLKQYTQIVYWSRRESVSIAFF